MEVQESLSSWPAAMVALPVRHRVQLGYSGISSGCGRKWDSLLDNRNTRHRPLLHQIFFAVSFRAPNDSPEFPQPGRIRWQSSNASAPTCSITQRQPYDGPATVADPLVATEEPSIGVDPLTAILDDCGGRLPTTHHPGGSPIPDCALSLSKGLLLGSAISRRPPRSCVRGDQLVTRTRAGASRVPQP